MSFSSEVGLYQRIRLERERQGLRQADIAAKIGLSRLTYINIESGSKSPTIDQFFSICLALNIEPGSLLFPEDEKLNLLAASLAKYRQMCLASITYGGNDIDQKISKTKLSHLLYLVDFSWYRLTGHSMSGLRYYRLIRGPVAEPFYQMIDDMFEIGEIVVELKGAAHLISSNEKSFQRDLQENELKHIKAICLKWQHANTQTLVDFTHKQATWMLSKPAMPIPYDLALQIPDEELF